MDLFVSGVSLVALSVAAIALSARLGRHQPGRWNGQDGGFVLIIMIVLSTCASLVFVRLATGRWDAPIEESLTAALVGTAAGSGVAVSCAMARAGLGGLGLRSAGARLWALLPVLALIFFMFSVLWSTALQSLGGEDQQQLLELVAHRWPAPDAVVVVIYGVLLAPLFEEVIFRGFLLPPAARHLGEWGGIVVTACLFGLMHLSDPFAVPPLIVLGALLGWTRLRSGSLWPAIVLHMFNNMLAIGVLIFSAAGQPPAGGLSAQRGEVVYQVVGSRERRPPERLESCDESGRLSQF